MKKKILKKLLNNLPLKILSILIAIVIWYVVVSVNDPIVKERFDVPVQVTNEAYIAAGKKTYQIAEEYQTVTVTVTDNNSVEGIGYHRHGRSDPDCDDGYKPGLCADQGSVLHGKTGKTEHSDSNDPCGNRGCGQRKIPDHN